MEHRSDIDGLRALAVLAVILNHADPGLLPGGFLGVDVFFVISGYVITGSLCARRDRTLGELLAAFYLRRIKRLLPALAVFVLAVALLASLFDPGPSQSLLTGFFALFGFSNVYLAHVEADYFGDPLQMNPFAHTWSLGVEEQFYLLFPALLWVLALRGPPRPRRTLAVLGSIAALSLAVSVYLSLASPRLAYFLMPARLWELAAGAMTFLALRAGRPQSAWTRPAASAALAGLVLLLFVPPDFRMATTVAACALAAAVIAWSRPGGSVFALLSRRPVAYVGRISYSLYLWHWAALALARWTIGVSWRTLPLLLGLTFAAAAASYRWVEVPARRNLWSPSRWREAGLATLGVAGAATLVFALSTTYEGALYAGQRPTAAGMGIDTLLDDHRAVGTTWQGMHCALADDKQVGRSVDPGRCTLGRPLPARSRVLVIGDSFAASFVPAFDALASQGHAVTIVPAWGASPVPEVPNHTVLKRLNDHYWRSVVPSLLGGLRPGDHVLLMNDLARFSPAVDTPAAREERAQLRAGLQRMARELRARHVSLAMLHGNPFLREAKCHPALAAPQWFTPVGGPCSYLSRQRTLERRAPLDAMLQDLQRQEGLQVIDLMALFCWDDTCHFQARDGALLYRDMHSHPSIEAARRAAPSIRDGLRIGADGA